ncbi:hypothetical protein EIP91_012432 [Steccherinum ochraceum]|uniref:DUF1793-domain-containing protein n=1 Tax=Steccherinum ochraceum TaxID=92696 RepID=A0A4V2MWS3_9APHY|nr:hypothetical protein EIP91_012432 [Steccherinum ochraceum]
MEYIPSRICFILLVSTLVASQAPPAWVPLAVRSPYFSAWNNASSPLLNTPNFWNQPGVLGWTGMIRVDGMAYEWMGGDQPSFNSTAVLGWEVTPTRTIYRFQAGTSMQVNITFLTPIEVDDLVKQSIPFSYFYLDAVSMDGQTHELQTYVDISGEWASGNRSETMTWKTTQTDTSTFHQIQLSSANQYQEIVDQAEDTTTYLATRSAPGVDSVVALLGQSRQTFAATGALAGSIPQSSSSISDNGRFPVFSISVDLGNILKTTESLMWAVGAVRNPVIAYTTPLGAVQNRAPYFFVQYQDVQSAIDAFLQDFEDARNRSITLDTKILGDAAKISPALSSVVSLSARQVIGATDVTVSQGSDGSWNASDTKIFMKDVGSSGRVNPVEILYASFPFFLYINPVYAGLLLEPMLEFQSSSQYTQAFAATDLGTTYPRATGNNRTHSQGIELSADLESFPNMSNLLIKGIIGVQAMANISQALGNSNDSILFSNHTQSLLQTWEASAIASVGTRVLNTYGDENSWTLAYNLYADKLLQTGLVNQSIYSSQTEFFKGLSSSSDAQETQFGMPIDSGSSSLSASGIATQADAAWTVFAAATMTDPSVRDGLLQPIYQHIVSNTSNFPYSKVYKLDSTGAVISGRASPALGAFFAPLALSLPFQDIVVPQSISMPSSATTKSIVGPVVGGVVGGLALLSTVVGALLFWRRRQRRQYPHVEKLGVNQSGLRPPTITVFDLSAAPGTASQIDSSVEPSSSSNRNQELLAAAFSSAGPILTSAKYREAMRARDRLQAISPVSAHPVTTPTTNSDSSPTSPASGPVAASPTTSGGLPEVQGLMTEVESLRRAVQEMRAERVEAPPSYSQ